MAETTEAKRAQTIINMQEKIDKLQAELATAKQEGDTMWDGLNRQVAELQAKIKELEQIIVRAKDCVKTLQDQKDKLQAELKRLKRWPDYFAWEREMEKLQAELAKYCKRCNGTGQVDDPMAGNSNMLTLMECPDCKQALTGRKGKET